MLTRKYMRESVRLYCNPESTRVEVDRISYPVTRIMYLENSLCQTNKLSVLFSRFLPSTMYSRKKCGSLDT
jgi:hypothetical protein